MKIKISIFVLLITIIWGLSSCKDHHYYSIDGELNLSTYDFDLRDRPRTNGIGVGGATFEVYIDDIYGFDRYDDLRRIELYDCQFTLDSDFGNVPVEIILSSGGARYGTTLRPDRNGRIIIRTLNNPPFYDFMQHYLNDLCLDKRTLFDVTVKAGSINRDRDFDVRIETNVDLRVRD